MNEPYRTIYYTLMTHNQLQQGGWHWNMHWNGSAFLIGTNQHHITVINDVPGWHVTIGGGHPGQVAGGFDDLVNLQWDVTPEIGGVLNWLRTHRVAW